MSTVLSPDRLAQLQQFVSTHMGLHFAEERWADLERGLIAAAAEFGQPNAEACAAWLLAAPLTRAQIEVLASHLTIGETYFFRDPECFAALEQRVLPELIRSRAGRQQRLRLWSAGCCSGEEAYSLAIVLTRVLPDLADWEITLLATDINPRALHKAATGVFGEWSFRNAAPGFKERYFQRRDERTYEIRPELRRMVTFSYLNLAHATYPSLATNTNAMDLICCRNVLMYFEPEVLRRATANLYRSLADGGWLLAAACEVSHANFPDFATEHFPGAIFYRKPAAPGAASAALLPSAPQRAPSPLLGTEANRSVEPPAPLLVPQQQSKSLPPPPQPLPALLPPPPAPQPAAPARAAFAQAQGLFEAGRYAEAGRVLAELAANAPPDARTLALWAHVCANEGKLTEARRLCEAALEQDKLNAALHYLRASVVQEQGELMEAAAAFQRALFLDPNFVLAHFGLGNLARRLGRTGEERRHFANARHLLHRLPAGEVLPESDGLTAGRLTEVIQSLLQQERET